MLALACALTACEGLNEGVAPSSLRLVSDSSARGPLEMTECGARQLFALARWEGDDTYDADVSALASWESSNPAVVEVSNAGVRAYNGGYYVPGTIFARAPGTARIRATYLHFSAAFVVRVAVIVEQRIMPEVTHLAPGSTATFSFQVRQDPDDPWTEVDSEWSIAQAQAAAAVEASSGEVRAFDGPEDIPFLLQASLTPCGVSATRELRVSPIERLELHYEQPPSQLLPVGLSTLIRVLAYFADAAASPQNLSSQVDVDLENTDEDMARYVASPKGIVLEGLVAGAGAQLNLRYAPLGTSVVTERYAFADVEQLGLRLDPASLTLHYPGEAQLQAIGSFSDGIERVVTREVAWTVSDSSVATITSEPFDSGWLSVIQDVDQDVTVEAFTTIGEDTVSAEADVRISRSD